MASQQLLARIKKSSKYYGQTTPGAWFEVRIEHESGHSIRGNDNNYRREDVVFGVRLDAGNVVELK
jgi:hypothetical protein